MNFKRLLLNTAAIVLSSSFTFGHLPIFGQAFAGEKNTIKVMSYNVENLFDWEHDAGKEDWSYLPKTEKRISTEQQSYCAKESNGQRRQECTDLDWTQETVLKKAFNVAHVIASTFDGTGPDVVVLMEIENIHALSLVQDNLKKYPYKALIEGPDARGVDVGVISRYPIVSSQLHLVDLPQHPTRGILQVDINVNGKKVVIFGNHWPSQNNPDENRMKAGATLIDAFSKLDNSADLVMAVGDFNTDENDDQNALKTLVADQFLDAQAEAKLAGKQLNPGTIIFKNHWTSIDKIFVAKKFEAQIDWTKFSIFAANFLMHGQKGQAKNNQDPSQGQVPTMIQFNPKTGEGYSDHLPLIMEFSL